MKRRALLKWLVGAPAFGALLDNLPETAWSKAVAATRTWRRVRPGDPGWPSTAEWDGLNTLVDGRLMKLADPLAACHADPSGKACTEFFAAIRNPYYILDQANLTQTSGWVDAWTSRPSAYAVAARSAADVAAAVNFARKHKLRLVIKGAGHSYQGTSDAPDSLLVWTHPMQEITLHDAFVPHGCGVSAQPAVSIGAGSIWGHTYDAVTTKAGRYVQGGGCLTVGVAGLVSSGGFGSWSKRFGTAAANLLEAEVVTADGQIRTVNACNDPDLFWALKGGGGGSFGVITRLTLRSHELPQFFGAVNATIKARSDAAYRRLLGYCMEFCRENLLNPHWGEKIHFHSPNVLRVDLIFQGLDQAAAEAVWKPFFNFVHASPTEFTITEAPRVLAFPARVMWNPAVMGKMPGVVVQDSRPGAAAGNFVWAGDAGQSGQYITSYASVWLSKELLQPNRQHELVDAVFASTRSYGFSMHFNKGLAGAPAEVLAAARDTATNPRVLDAFALVISGDSKPAAFPGIPGHQPDLTAAREDATACAKAMQPLHRVAAGAGSYVSESDYFLKDWQHAFWGTNYARLRAVKRRYDPVGLFIVHHGVGSEEWSADGFARKP